jgi:carboxypeptidase Taq
LEKALLRGELQVDELPSAFNAAVRTQLGLETPNDTVGVLQDIHWSLGLFGYFPTYLLGNIYAAEWARAAATALGDLSERVAAGRLKTIRDWLRHEIHRHGRRYTVHQLFARVCGRPPSPQSFGQYLKDKYGPIYGLSL